MTDPLNQTTKAESLHDLAERHAQAAMAKIADAQMNTWSKFPPLSSPTDFVRHAILQALEDAGVKL